MSTGTASTYTQCARFSARFVYLSVSYLPSGMLTKTVSGLLIRALFYIVSQYVTPHPPLPPPPLPPPPPPPSPPPPPPHLPTAVNPMLAPIQTKILAVPLFGRNVYFRVSQHLPCTCIADAVAEQLRPLVHNFINFTDQNT